jgi:hypothetical protein
MIIPLTVYTSLSFSMVSYVAFMKQMWFLGTLWQLLCGLSTINHMYTYRTYKGKYLVSNIDTALAHAVVLASIYFALTTPINPIALWIFWLCLAYMTTTYYVVGFSKFPNRSWEPWHASLHIAAVIGEIALMLGGSFIPIS